MGCLSDFRDYLCESRCLANSIRRPMMGDVPPSVVCRFAPGRQEYLTGDGSAFGSSELDMRFYVSDAVYSSADDAACFSFRCLRICIAQIGISYRRWVVFRILLMFAMQIGIYERRRVFLRMLFICAAQIGISERRLVEFRMFNWLRAV